MVKYQPIGLTDLEKTLLDAAKLALNFISNTEAELNITLLSGDALRKAIEEAESLNFICCKGSAPIKECACYKSTLRTDE